MSETIISYDQLMCQCGYADVDAPVESHCGCTHPECSDKIVVDGKTYGQCYPWACPLGRELCADEEGEDRKFYEKVYGIPWDNDNEIMMVVDESLV
jgi:hypothetical protein